MPRRVPRSLACFRANEPTLYAPSMNFISQPSWVNSNEYLPGALRDSSAVLQADCSLESYRSHMFTSSANLSDSPSSMDFANQPHLVVGQNINNNLGIPLHSINKIPSYQWSSKNDDPEHHPTKTKHILSGLGAADSVSSLGAHTMGASSLNSKLVRLPLLNETTDGTKWSLANGLPYYDKEYVDKQIRYLNQKKARTMSNRSQFSAQMNETIDDVEYLHGTVILNQFLNNKRLVRNYQWLMYFADKQGGRKLSDKIGSYDNVKYKSVRNFQKSVERKMARQQREEMERRKREMEGLPPIPPQNNAESDEDEQDEEEEGPRFQTLDIPVNLTKELIIEKELPIDDKELIDNQNRLYGIQNSYRMLEEARQTDGIIHSRVLRLRRKPNPNALGYSNIRCKKPPYA
ncbi:hypothetical protein KL941_004613 [Ogataea angusta]|nr:hypothetical protein KL941_004613 [Ogataea angusta]